MFLFFSHAFYCTKAAGETDGLVIIQNIITIIFIITIVCLSASVAGSSLVLFSSTSGANSVRLSSWVQVGSGQVGLGWVGLDGWEPWYQWDDSPGQQLPNPLLTPPR